MKLFKKHNVVNVYFESNNKKIKVETRLKQELKEAEYFRDYMVGIFKEFVKIGDCYLFPYFSKDKVYLKVGVKNSLTRKQLNNAISNYQIRIKKMETLRVWFDEFKKEHYTIEKLKFVGYAMGWRVKQELLNDRRFMKSGLEKFCSLSGDLKNRKKLSDDEWLNLLHHMFLPLMVEYTDEVRIYQKSIAQLQSNINKMALK